MAEVKFELAEKSEQLLFSIFDITTNRAHYPVKFRRLGDKLQEYSLEIHGEILDANAYRADTPRHQAKKFELQTSIITKCNKLMSLIKYSLYAHLISYSTSEKWTALVHDIKNMTLAWRKT